jgi:hypothetical protein
MERLRESYIFNTDQYTKLNKQQIDGLHITPKLTESIQYSTHDIIQIATQLKESLQENEKTLFDRIINQLRENGVNNSFSVWKLPIGRYGNLNGNRRIYPKKLWENVKEKQGDIWRNFCGLCDHPVADNDPGEFKNQAIIWHDMDIGDNGVVYGFGSFVGPYGHLAQEILEHGGRVGTSSSGFGDVDKYSNEVIPDSYTIERLADLVLHPSQGTFGGPESTHTSGDFMKNLNQGATIEFEKSKAVREAAQSQIVNRRNIVADQQKFDAANPQAATAQPQAQPAPQQPAQQPAAQQGAQPAPQASGTQGAAPAQSQGAPQQKESVEMSQSKGTLTKVEEKAFRKYVASFIDDANTIDNPIKRLNECVDILDCFEEGNCPDLKTQLEEQLLKEKGDLEKLVEKVIQTEKEYEMPIHKFRESAERNTMQGLLLNEQVSDYKELCDGLAKRNQQLREENDKLLKTIKIKDKLTEKKIYKSNHDLVNASSSVDQLQEEVETLRTKNKVLIEKASKLALSNKEFEKENGVLTTKIREAGQIIKGFKQNDVKKLEEQTKVAQGIQKLNEKIAELEKLNEQLVANYDKEVKVNTQLQESFDSYKKEVNDTYNPVAHLVPKFEERVGKYLNLRENKGIEVESYWSDLVSKYGDAVKPFESKIRDVKTLREATNAFLRYRTEIDPDFAVSQPVEYAYRNRSERAKLYEHVGVINPVESYANSSVEQKNTEFLNSLKNQGLQ